jgi:orotate phosphoribosyltransferase
MNLDEKVLEVLSRVGAIRSGHFVLTSTRHTDRYVNKNQLYLYPQEVSEICACFAVRFSCPPSPDIVIGPATGAICLSQWTAFHLTMKFGQKILSAYADKTLDGNFEIKRGYDKLLRGRKVLVVEDVITTGGSARKVIACCRELGAEVVGLATICNREGITGQDIGLNGEQFYSLLNLGLESWKADECELCKRGIPIDANM